MYSENLEKHEFIDSFFGQLLYSKERSLPNCPTRAGSFSLKGTEKDIADNLNWEF
jgi:hypothetical protein